MMKKANLLKDEDAKPTGLKAEQAHDGRAAAFWNKTL